MSNIINKDINNIKRVGIYLRLSNEDRNKENILNDSESIKNQRNLLLDEITKRDDFILIDEYCDEDLSGAGTYRPEFERLIKDCENGKIDIVLCKSQSRFSRDLEVIEKYIHNKFLEWNIRFISLSDNADTDNYGNKKSRQINGLVNEWYLEDVSNNIRGAFKAKMIEGEFISPFAAFGYNISKSNNNKLVIDPIAACVVRKIYYLYLKGMGFTSIAKYLNENNISSPSFYKYQKGIKLNIVSSKPREKIKWSTNMIKNILTNELYIGNLIQGKRTTVSYKNHKIIKRNINEWIRKNNTHEAIIDNDTFNKVQIAIKERTRQLKKTGYVHVFSGKVFCFECGHYMRKKNSSKHQYLVCSNSNSEYNNCSNKSSIRYDELEQIILKKINEKISIYLSRDILCNFLNNEYYNKKIKSLELNKNNLAVEISKLKNYLKSIYEDKCNQLIDKDEFKYLENYYRNSEYLYNNQLKDVDKELEWWKNKKECKSIIEKYQYFSILNKEIVDEFIKKIYIEDFDKLKKTRNIKIVWNFDV